MAVVLVLRGCFRLETVLSLSADSVKSPDISTFCFVSHRVELAVGGRVCQPLALGEENNCDGPVYSSSRFFFLWSGLTLREPKIDFATLSTLFFQPMEVERLRRKTFC
jgi:hypothetical protein